MDFRSIGGGSKVVKTFADSFARTDQPFGLGDQWGLYPVLGSAGMLQGTNIAAAINVSANQANFTICSTNGQNFLMCFPLTITWNKDFFANQFAQCVISADNSGGAVFAFNGPAVFMNCNKSTGYWIKTNANGVGNQTGRYIISAINGSGAETVIDSNSNTGYPWSIGDLLRLEGRAISSTQTQLKHYRNGVLVNTVIDSTGHYQSGVCGFFDYFISSGVTQSIQNFLGGAL